MIGVLHLLLDALPFALRLWRCITAIDQGQATLDIWGIGGRWWARDHLIGQTQRKLGKLLQMRSHQVACQRQVGVASDINRENLRNMK